MTVPSEVVALVERFRDNTDAYRSAAYNEAQVRQEFINPLFEALGWDVSNSGGYAEPYKDVIHEASLKIDGVPRAPDYSFRIGGTRKFFVEAKKPAVDLRHGAAAAFQLRRYAWSANLPLSILTDFEEWAVYDTRVRPQKTDKPATARVSYLKCEDYPARWSEISSVFSKEAVLRGSFDRFAEAASRKRGTAEVDSEFLSEIEAWREVLARNIALRNPALGARALNAVVQMTIDRIVFLRISEDRGVEPYGQLRDVAAADSAYEALLALFVHADRKYNSGLFHFRKEAGRTSEPDVLSTQLVIDNKAIHHIVRRLYYPDSPYEFSVIPPHILGSVYERFLGSVVRLTPSHRAVVETKPEVRKAGGVYYTPRPIVRYIVEHAIGPLLEGRHPDDLEALHVVDPSCGSGSFLLEAYHYLLDWYLNWYVENRDRYRRKFRDRLRSDDKGALSLSGAERKRILLTHIFGVDIDSQAVEVTKLALLLSVLEGETSDSLNAQMTLFASRALPDLGQNIKSGNALIGDDFFEQGAQLSLVDDDRLYEVNAFNWRDEFPHVFDTHGGFSAVIGNPPYVLIQDRFRDDEQLAYVRERFDVARYKVDTYHLFIERGLEITRPGGRCAMITPANFLTNNHLSVLREHMVTVGHPDHVLVLDGGVFDGVSVDNAIFVVTRGGSGDSFPVRKGKYSAGQIGQETEFLVDRVSVLADEHHLFTGSVGELTDVWRRITPKARSLGDLAYVNFGKQLRDRRIFTDDVISVASKKNIPSTHRPCITGSNVTRYRVTWGGLACLDSEEARCGGTWDPSRHEARPKLVTRQIGRYPEFGLDPDGLHCLNTVFMVSMRDESMTAETVLGILNSSLMRAYWIDHFYDQRRTFPKIKGTYLKQLPVLPSGRGKKSAGILAELDQLARERTRLAQQAEEARGQGGDTVISRRIDGVERAIDRAVFDLFEVAPSDRVRIAAALRPPDEVVVE